MGLGFQRSPVEVYELNYSTGWGNYSCRESAVTDAYLDQALAQTDVEASYEYWKKAMWDGTEGPAPQEMPPGLGSLTSTICISSARVSWLRRARRSRMAMVGLC